MKTCLMVFVTVLVASQALAQTQHALPFTKRPVSQIEYATALRHNDLKLLNVSCDDVLNSLNKAFDVDYASCAALASYVSDILVVKPCPNVVTTLARKLPDGTIDLRGFSRSLRVGEQCLYDNNAAKWIASLSCGNLITQDLPVYTAMVAEKSEVESKPQPTPATPITQAVTQAAANLTPAKSSTSESIPTIHASSFFKRNWKWLAIAAVGGGVGAAVYAASHNSQTVTVTNVVK